MNRRHFLQTLCLGGLATFARPSIHLARVPGSGRLLFVLLRGGFDGLAALVPVGDPDYRGTRGDMAFGQEAVRMLDGPFGLAPGLAPLADFWARGELVALHAMAIPYRSRSHFESQAILETGLDAPRGSADGWLNRLLQVMGGTSSGIAVGAGLPRSLSGDHPVATWSPAKLGVVDDAYQERLHLLYRHDPDLHDAFEAALQFEAVSDDMQGGNMQGGNMQGSARRARGQMPQILGAAARFLRDPDGPNVAAVEFSGWDTHANQGRAGGALDRRFQQLSDGLTRVRAELGRAWNDTTVVVMTEFGRTARPNGTGGTDHGTAGAGFVLSPNVAQSAVVADWPGLADDDLFENRDLRSTLDTRAVLKGVIAGTFDLTRVQSDRVFPGSQSVPGRVDLMA